MTSSELLAIAIILMSISGAFSLAWLFAWGIKCWVVRWLKREGWNKS